MSGRSFSKGYRNSGSGDRYTTVEDYRQKNRQHHRNQNEGDRKQRLEKEREERMAKLREELKKEDETLAALDQQQQQQQQDQHNNSKDQQKPQESIIEVNQEELEGLDEEEQMRKLLGFDGFGSTKGVAVEDNQSTAARGGAAKNKARKYRQYMNRKNGFNRPLEKMN